ncbi:hypothetical protein NDU88_006179 [Pleurodeles waltl]|uniref:Uncharacterized protein n=1 Tax=Pleurodeles waltl TaxID=8319 RepID=A0AAV7SNV3_PLEWA|nr:hypothetical protein NDU88_006179 [Pleurodeles waltl]
MEWTIERTERVLPVPTSEFGTILPPWDAADPVRERWGTIVGKGKEPGCHIGAAEPRSRGAPDFKMVAAELTVGG